MPSTPASLCGGASLELEQELTAAGFDVVRSAPVEGAWSRAFDAAVQFTAKGDEVKLLDLRAPAHERQAASLRVDCNHRLNRRRVWTLIVEMLWARSEGPQPLGDVSETTAAPPKLSRVDEQTMSMRASGVRPVPTHEAFFFGAGPVVGANAFASDPVWDAALLGGYRSPRGYKLAARLRWPVTVAQARSDSGSTRTWTFTTDVEAGKVFARPQGRVQPYVGTTMGLHFTLLDATGGERWQERRWGALHLRTLGHLGLGVALPHYTLFCQLEAGLARRLQVEANARGLDRGRNIFVAAAALGVTFDY